ncbi:hypothetical protein QM646_48395, partial [Rhodococcus erythropolis]|nr:hypothetical protein [Rhodococcus erythropolis]
RDRHTYTAREALEKIAAQRDYRSLLEQSRILIEDIPAVPAEKVSSPTRYNGTFEVHQRYMAYSLDQESFKFLMDPMLTHGAEKVSA